jgi:ParB family transcriptional regulator, chromosome partitioning protein
METATTVRTIPLDRLVLSPANARKTPPSAAEDAELKASIKTRGLKQNLVVCPAPERTGVYAVTAGSRRLKALQELAAEGAIPADYEVPCLVEEAAAALETSLMENTVRAAMHPADEFAAMAALIDAGENIEVVATRFGVSERHVKQRLRLGKVAPELLDEFRAGKLSLEVMTAFTLGADHATQLAMWRQVRSQSYIQPYTVRRLLTEGAAPLGSRLGEFVGIAAYEAAAGGAVTRDLFSGDEYGFLDDAALVRRLALEKLEEKARELRPHWLGSGRCSTPLTASPPNTRISARKLPNSRRRSPPSSRLSRTVWRHSKHSPRTPGARASSARPRTCRRHDELVETSEAEAVYAPENRARAGCIVTIGEEGGFRLYEGLVERAAWPGEPGSGAAEDAQDGDRAFPCRPGSTLPAPRPPSGEERVRKECGFSQTLVT